MKEILEKIQLLLQHAFNKAREKKFSFAVLKKMPKKRMIVTAVIFLVAVVGISKLLGKNNTVAASTYIEETVQTRNIAETISGSGTLEPADSYTITTLLEGEILSANFEEGDEVKTDDILYEIDSSDLANTIEQGEISLSQAQRNYESKVEDVSNLNVKAPISGTITALDVEVGDQVNSDQSIGTIQDTSVVKLEVPFQAEEASNFSVGAKAEVTLYGSFETLQGTVTAIDSASTILTGNVMVKYVTIEVENPGAIGSDQTATAAINGVDCLSSGTFEYKYSRNITAEVSGTVVEIVTKKSSIVDKNDVILVLESETVSDSLQDASDSLRNSEISMENNYEKLDDYTITSPIDGTIIEKTYKAGDTIESGSALCTIYDLSYLKVTLNVDELDISNVEVGQTVTVTADAVEDKVYKGVVTKVTHKGTTSGGVTTYPVEVQITDTEGLLPGMNVSTEIMITQAENVIAVPVSAVTRGNKVLVKGGEEEAADEDVPSGYGYVTVEVGASDGNYIEITSGLSEDDEIAYVQSAGSSSSDQMMMGGMAMPGGGMPSGGGMSGGGAPGGGGR